MKGRISPRGWGDVRLFVVVAAVYALTASYWIGTISIDVIAAEEPAFTLVEHGTLNLRNFPHHDLIWYFEHDGGVYSDRFPAAILYLVPFYGIASMLGLNTFSLVPGAVAAAVISAATVVVMRRVFEQFLLPGQAHRAALFFGFGTATWTVSANAPWSHTLDQLLIALTLLALSRRSPALAGVSAGLLVPVRPVLGLAVIAIALHFLAGRSAGPLMRFVVFAAPGTILLVAYNGLLFDRWGPSNGRELGGDVSFSLGDLLLNVAGTLLSPERGLLFLYPFIFVVMPHLKSAWRRSEPWARTAVIAGFLALAGQLGLNRFSGGHFFYGSRLTIEALTFAAPVLAMAVVLTFRGRTSTALHLALCWSVVVHAIGALVPIHAERMNAPWTTFGPWEVAKAAAILVVPITVLAAWAYRLASSSHSEPATAAVERPAVSRRKKR